MEKMPILEKLSESSLIVQDWGLIPYQEALKRQMDLVQQVFHEESPGYLVMCTHPPVVTAGRATQPDDIFSWEGETVEVSRGGRATYHGPSQIVLYPILNLKFPRKGRVEKEVVGYLRVFENAIVQTLHEIGIESQGRSLQKKNDSAVDETGVWTNGRKIASLGIAVKKWVTYHGPAINFDFDPKAFKGINPCGFQSDIPISVEQLIGTEISRQQFEKKLIQNVLDAL